jgi:cadmium resistance protein CadD (predicted permease)
MGFWHHQYFWPAVLIVLGVYFLLNNLGFLWWLEPRIAWPVVLIALGVWLLLRRSRA